jgi:hypothetical protein
LLAGDPVQQTTSLIGMPPSPLIIGATRSPRMDGPDRQRPEDAIDDHPALGTAAIEFS